MFNDPLIQEEARLKIVERAQEAESYHRTRQLGYGERGIARWVVALIALVIAMALVIVLL